MTSLDRRCEATRRAKCRPFMNPERIEVWTRVDVFDEVDSELDPDRCASDVYVCLPLADGGDFLVSPNVVGGGCHAPRAGTPCVWHVWEPEVHPRVHPRRPELR